ncbi:neogenin-like [Mya arenaria]|uniref:neogenin-like n=1 Tax=Mya arenaria TaxID=6604 RepID=UPI0022E69054|nr:neogenin-like [Mya arenaria]
MDGLFKWSLWLVAVVLAGPCAQGDTANTNTDKGLAIAHGKTSHFIVHKNDELVINCSVVYNTSLGPANYTWLKNDEFLDFTSRRIQVFTNGSLYIRRILHRPRKDISDDGRYKCYVRLENAGTVIARDVQISVADFFYNMVMQDSN